MKSFLNSMLAVAAMSLTACSMSDNAAEEVPAGVLEVESVLPLRNANGIWQTAIPGTTTVLTADFVVTFTEDVQIEVENPAGISLVNKETGATLQEEAGIFEEVHWTLVPGKDSKSVIVKLVNEKGSICGISVAAAAGEYALTIPAKVITTPDLSKLNALIVAPVFTSEKAVLDQLDVLEVEKVEPNYFKDGIWGSNNPWAPSWKIEFNVTFKEDVVIAKENPTGISLINDFTDEAIEDIVIGADKWVVEATDDAKVIKVSLKNSIEGTCGTDQLKDAALNLTIPAGIVFNADATAANGEITAQFLTSKDATKLHAPTVAPKNVDENGYWTPTMFATTSTFEFIITFDEPVNIIEAEPAGITLINGKTGADIMADESITQYGAIKWVVKAVKDNDKAVSLRLENTTGSVMGKTLDNEIYDLTVPIEIVENVKGNRKNGVISATIVSSEEAYSLRGAREK